jgi:uncharacterized protein (DUF2267 family)
MKHDEWIEQVQHRARLSSHGQAERATRATLETLTEHLAGEEATALAAQLPLEMGEHLRSQWSPRGERSSLEECLRRSNLRVGIDLPVAIFQSRAVIDVLGEAISKAEMDDVRAQLPAEFDRLCEAGSTGHMLETK